MSGQLKVEIVKADAVTPDQIQLWTAMADGNPELGSPYFCWDFARIASEVSPNAAIAVFRRGDEIIGFFPFQRRGGAIQPIGAPMNDYHGVIARREDMLDLDDVARLIFEAVPRARRINVGGWVGPATGAVANEGVMTTLPGGDFNEWYAERRRNYGKFFKDKERARRSMETEFGPVTIEIGLRDPVLLDQLLKLKREQYRRTRIHDIFACKWTRELLHALMKTEGRFGASMAVLRSGGQVLAIEYSLHAGDRYHFWFPAYVPEMARCSPGIILTMETMRLAAEDGYSEFDFGIGGGAYKKYFCNTLHPLSEAIIMRPGLQAAAVQVGAGMLKLAGAERSVSLKNSIRRRWAAIEASETTVPARLGGVLQAVRAAAAKGRGGGSRH